MLCEFNALAFAVRTHRATHSVRELGSSLKRLNLNGYGFVTVVADVVVAVALVYVDALGRHREKREREKR